MKIKQILNRLKVWTVGVIDGLFFMAGFILFDTTIYFKSWFWGGIVTAITLIIMGLMSEQLGGDG